MTENMNIAVKKYFVLLVMLCSLILAGANDDATASAVYVEGRDLYLDGEYYDAAKKFEECRIYTKNPTIRANSLIAQMASYRMSKLYYREFTMIEELLERYPEYVNCNDLIAREFEIAGIFRGGYREPAFWIFRWIPYMVDEDRTAEIYSAALKRAPYSEFAPAAHMQLAIYYDLEGEVAKSLAELRNITERHPNSSDRKYALLALANGLFELSKKGDGDGKYVNEAVELFRLFCEQYPDADEVKFARNKLAQAKDIQAEKLFTVAEFYRRRGRSEVAERYLAQIMSRYPDSEKAAEAEKVLVDVSNDYLPGIPPEKNEARLPDIRSYNIPENSELLLISPGDRESHYLLEVPDIKGEKMKETIRKGKEDQ